MIPRAVWRRGLPAHPIFLVIGALFAGSCALFTAPLPDGAKDFDPPGTYARWWAMVEQCSGLTRRMSDIDWYEAPGASFTSPSGNSVNGVYLQGSERIVIARSFVRDGAVVRHEMLHALIRRNDKDQSHPAEYFLKKCGGVVHCEKGCIATAGPIEPPPATPLHAASILDVSIEVDSVVPLAQYSDFVYLPVIVRARNPLDAALRIELATVGTTKTSFIVGLGSNGSTNNVSMKYVYPSDPRAAYFEPGETKVHVFDIYLPRSQSTLGTWEVGGGFATNWMNEAAQFRVQ